MTKVTITDPNLATALNTADVPLEIRTPDGALLGYFTPVRNTEYIHADDDLPRDELRRRLEDRGSKHYTKAEIQAKLRGSK